jgi:hypothetical protein
VTFNRVGNSVGVRTICNLPGSAFKMSGGDGGGDSGCHYPVIKIFEDGSPRHDPNSSDPNVYITEMSTTTGTWSYVESSNWHDVPIDANPPAGVSFDEWQLTFPTFQEAAGGNRVFKQICLGPDAEYWTYPDVTVPITDPFWSDLPGQLADLVAQVPLESPSIAFTPSTDVWGGFLTNAPYGVTLADHGIWHSVTKEKLDPLGAWRLTVVASPVSATVTVTIGNKTKEMDCKLGSKGPVTLTALPRYDPPGDPLKNLPPCAFTARWAKATSVSVRMRMTYHVVGFINGLAQTFPPQDTTSGLLTRPVVRVEAANSDAH